MCITYSGDTGRTAQSQSIQAPAPEQPQPQPQAQPASTNNMLQGPINAQSGMNGFLEFIKLLIALIVKWFVYPFIIYIWLYAGYLFVKAQGNPAELKEAREWIWWTFIGTVIILLAQGFAHMFIQTMKQIFSN